MVQVAEAERVHDGDRAGTHRHDVADDAADAGRGALVGLDVGRVVVRLDLEGHRPAVADVDDAGVLTDADEELLAHLVGGVLAPQLEVDLARLVGAVLAPHDGVHRELGDGRAAPDDLADVGVLVGLEAELGPRLLDVGRRRGVLDGVEDGARDGLGVAHAVAALSRVCLMIEVKKPRPSRLGP